MGYKLFLDDYRDPSYVSHLRLGSDWVVARDFEQAKDLILTRGYPDFISFDHDLGENHYDNDWSDASTGYDFAKWFCHHVGDPGKLPDFFDYYVHSMNPVGAERIRDIMKDFFLGGLE